MIERITKAVTGQQRADPLARLAILSVPVLLTIIGALLGGQLAEIKASIGNNTEGVATLQRGFDVQQQILQTGTAIDADQETRIRVLENWRAFVINNGAQ